MKLIHFSDTHLGFNDLDILNKNNINQREADFYDVFLQVIEQIKTTKALNMPHIATTRNHSTPKNKLFTISNLLQGLISSMYFLRLN